MHQRGASGHLIQGRLRILSKSLGQESAGMGHGEEKQRDNLRGADIFTGGNGLGAAKAGRSAGRAVCQSANPTSGITAERAVNRSNSRSGQLQFGCSGCAAK
jgi:hypothetical protein